MPTSDPPTRPATAPIAASGTTYPVISVAGGVGSSAMTGHSVLGVRQMFLARVTVSKDPPELNVWGHGRHGQALQRRRVPLRTCGQPDHTRVPGVKWSSGASHGPPRFDRVRDSRVCIGTCDRPAEYPRGATVRADATNCR